MFQFEKTKMVLELDSGDRRTTEFSQGHGTAYSKKKKRLKWSILCLFYHNLKRALIAQIGRLVQRGRKPYLHISKKYKDLNLLK